MLKDVLTARLARVRENGLYRVLRPIDGAQDAVVRLNGHDVLLFSSNNYLGLANHPVLKRAAAEAIERFGCGSGASRLISGSMAVHHELEARLAALKKTEAALVFSTGYHANVGVLSALMGPGDTILSDGLNHASIIDGCRLSRAEVRVYPHGDTHALTALLAACPPSGQRLIVTDTVFSMDGDLAPLAELVELARRHDAWLMVDEAHATGVFGPHGGGLVEQAGLEERVDIHMGTLGKALGGIGAYVAGSRELIDWLVNRARSFVYTTGMPPAAAASALAALDLVEREPERRQRLWDNTRFLSDGLRGLGYRIGDSRSQILPVIIGNARQTMALAAATLRRGVFAHGIRPPTVPEGTSRIRVTPMATHTRAQLERTLDAFESAGKEVGVL